MKQSTVRFRTVKLTREGGCDEEDEHEHPDLVAVPRRHGGIEQRTVALVEGGEAADVASVKYHAVQYSTVQYSAVQ